MELQMPRCDLCGTNISHFKHLQCCTESGKSVNPITNYTINNNNIYLKPNHSKFFSEICGLHDNNQVKFTLKHIFQLKENIKQENSELHKSIMNNEQTMILYVTKIEEKIQQLETIMLTDMLNEKIQQLETMLNEKKIEIHKLTELINNKNENSNNSLIHKIIMNKEEQMERKNQKIHEKIYKVATFIQLSNLMNCLLVYLIYYYS